MSAILRRSTQGHLLKRERNELANNRNCSLCCTATTIRPFRPCFCVSIALVLGPLAGIIASRDRRAACRNETAVLAHFHENI
jgi:hypothetical protein